MELPLFYISKFKITKKGEEQTLADEIYLAYNKKIKYPHLMKIIKEKGIVFVRETFNECKEAKEPFKLFLWKVKNCKVRWR
jgi:hypothetical protein